MTNRIDIGLDHFLRPYTGQEDDVIIGFIVEHPHPVTGKECGGSVLFDTAPQKYRSKRADGTLSDVWQVLQGAPNWTLDPSLQCGMCPDHGYVRNGRWVKA